MRGGNSAWPKEQDRRSFLLCKTVECLACNEGAEDLCFKTSRRVYDSRWEKRSRSVLESFCLVSRRGIMPTRAEILDTLTASQTQVMAFFQGLSPEDLERPATASDVPGAAPWRAKDHFAHLGQNERNIQHLLRHILAGETRDVLLRLQYPEGMPLPGTLGDLSALTPEEEERLELAIASINQTYLNAHHDDTLE